MPEKLPFVVRKYGVRSEKISAPVKFVFLTDFHDKEFDAGNARLIREIHAISPDAVLVGGDMVISMHAKEESDDWLRRSRHLLEGLRKDGPVFAALGNHEAALADEKRGIPACFEAYCGMLDDAGVTRLENSSADFRGIRIHGLAPDRIYYKKLRYRRLDKTVITTLLGDAPEDVFSLLLAHHPRFFAAYAAWGADLTLAGHLHGGMLRIGNRGVISPDPMIFPRYSGGEYHIGNRTMIVSCGLGMPTIPVRICNPPELSVIALLPG